MHGKRERLLYEYHVHTPALARAAAFGVPVISARVRAPYVAVPPEVLGKKQVLMRGGWFVKLNLRYVNVVQRYVTAIRNLYLTGPTYHCMSWMELCKRAGIRRTCGASPKVISAEFEDTLP